MRRSEARERITKLGAVVHPLDPCLFLVHAYEAPEDQWTSLNPKQPTPAGNDKSASRNGQQSNNWRVARSKQVFEVRKAVLRRWPKVRPPGELQGFDF